MKLKHLLDKLEYTLLQGNLDTEVTAVENDSRRVTEGALFFCIKGAAFDGHQYAQEAADKKASVLVVEQEINLEKITEVTVIKAASTRYAMGIICAAFYGNPADKLTVIGITGTKGKTTTTYMIKSMLESAGKKTGLIGTIESIVGEKIVPASNTTPESIVIQKTLKEMVDAGLDSVVMEVSSQGLMLDRVAGISFDYGIFTNLSPDHIGPNEHKDFAEYMGWKAKLFTLCKTGIFNIDDEHCKDMLKEHTGKMVTYGMKENADYRAVNLKRYEKDGFLGITYELEGKYREEVTVSLPGEFSVHNSLSAIAVAKEMGVPMKTILEILTKIQVKGRVEMIPISDDFTLIIDYAHNAVSLESMLNTLREYQPGRLVALFGCGGNRDRNRRYEMGEVSGRLADFTIITSDNPRNEEPQAIIDDIKTGMAKTDGRFLEIVSRKEAIRYAIMHAQKGDIIVLAGKGHEDYQEIKGKKYHMDERELIKEILEEEDVTKICGYNNRYFS
ncbi:MAG: UDP-N-acetylmuramoyl-L-alanyl-D-glutamate--2,6-diaminopimelate ligase [Bacteroidales bacterium]|nr:UDP-N-acetylmuramoyl-L-alanyl-D-glutamate--2,6-diaminopimelate ligase [Clostridium sp.]MCM1202659.1 UDP-N-acetylmuramoyl-L-alanyl-D-glutamate--2,6-diaminopimelate ligase [Bacteroidales bacterium]